MFSEVGGALVLQQDVLHSGGRRQERIPVRRDHLIELALDDHVANGLRDAAAGIEMLEECRADELLRTGHAAGQAQDRQPDLAEQRSQRAEAIHRGPLIGRGEADEHVHVWRPAEELDVVARHHAALGMTHQIHLCRARGGQDLVGECGELLCRLHDVGQAVEVAGSGRVGTVVERVDAVAGVGQHWRQCLPTEVLVRERAVDKDDRIGVARRGSAAPDVGSGRIAARISEFGGGSLREVADR
jgi:hypothetical protein